MQDFLNNVRRHIQSHLDSSYVYLLFDRYKEGEITEIKEPVECILCVQQPNVLLRKLFLP